MSGGGLRWTPSFTSEMYHKLDQRYIAEQATRLQRQAKREAEREAEREATHRQDREAARRSTSADPPVVEAVLIATELIATSLADPQHAVYSTPLLSPAPSPAPNEPVGAAIIDALKCTICLDMYEDPLMLSGCGHTFCRECIKKWLQGRASHKNVCPHCKMPARWRDCLPAHSLASVVQAVRSAM